MGLHVYCIVPSGHAPERATTGLLDAPVRLLDVGATGAWVSEHAARPESSLAHVRRHNAVVVHAMNHEVTPVPARFGQWFADEDAARGRLREHAERWAALLARLAGHAEFSVVVLSSAEPAAPARDVHAERPTTGTQYLRTLAAVQAQATARRREAERIEAAIDAAVESHVADRRAEAGDGRMLVRLAHLVAWSDADAYHSSVRRVARDWREHAFHFDGPWPPYSFAE